jgi:hypothetical protein
MNENELLDIYTDYLISSFGLTTATGLSQLLNGAISHDRIQRFLGSAPKTGKALWLLVKPYVRQVQSDTGVIIIDHANQVSLPVNYRLIEKTETYTDKKTGKEKRRSPIRKNEI